MIFIGVSEKVVRNTYRDYGFESLDDILFVEGNAKEHTEPGWDLFEMEIAERLSAYDSVAIAQMNAEENGGTKSSSSCKDTLNFSVSSRLRRRYFTSSIRLCFTSSEPLN